MRQQFSLFNGPLKNRLRWQEPLWFWPTPADQAFPNAPVVPQYTFRPGGFWQTQKLRVFALPADVAVPNAPIVPQYVFRRGKFWKPEKMYFGTVLVDAVAPPPPVVLLTDMDALRRPNHRRSAWLAAWAVGSINDAELVALLNQEKN